MKPHWRQRIEQRVSAAMDLLMAAAMAAAMDLLMAVAIGLAMAAALAYWWTEQIP